MELTGRRLSLEEIASVAKGGTGLSVSIEALDRIRSTRAVVEKLLSQSLVVYGVNTGFGKLADIRVPDSELEAL